MKINNCDQPHSKTNGKRNGLRGIIPALTAVFMLFSLTACGSGNASENQLAFSSGGAITADYFSYFPTERYNMTLFEEEAGRSVKAYNEEAGSSRISILGTEEEDNTAHLRIRYKSFEDYEAFNHQELYYGTIADGLSELALTGNVKLRAVEGSESVTLRELGEAEKNGEARYRIIAVCDSIVLKHKGTPIYISDNVKIDDDGTVRANPSLAEGELPETAYVVYKK